MTDNHLVLWVVTARCHHCDWTDIAQGLNKSKAADAGSVLMVAHHDMAHPECNDHDFGVRDHGIIA